MIAATAYDPTTGEECTGLLLRDGLLQWEHGNPVLHPVAAILREWPATTVLTCYRQLAGWLATRPAHMWAHLHDALDELADNLTPDSSRRGAPTTSAGSVGTDRPRGAFHPEWFT